jgi:RimJ/RimL family protein N-acetyltransferase
VTAPWNLAARRVMEKAGLTYHGTRPYRGLTPEPVVYAIDRLTWEAREREAIPRPRNPEPGPGFR